MSELSVDSNLSSFINIQSYSSVDQTLKYLIAAIRSHLEMDVAFISEFSSTHRIFRYIDSKSKNPIIKVGGSDLLEDSFCKKVVDNELPQIIQNAMEHPQTSELPVVHAIHLGAHISVPITLESGEVYGTFCCFSHNPSWTLNERDLSMMRVFAAIAAKQIQNEILQSRENSKIVERIQSVLDSDALSIVYQPIYNLSTKKIVGFESLSRFNTLPDRTPDVWFKESAQVGLGIALEIKAVQMALKALSVFPDNLYISVNLSPETILSGSIDAVFENIPLERVILEVTEHAYVNHYGNLAQAINHLRDKKMWLAVDDAGAGFSSFRHILSLSPEVIKIDMSITRDINTDRARRALTSAFVGFSEETNCKIVAEGVETELELNALKGLGVNFAQGYFVGMPMTMSEAMTTLSLQ